MNILSALKSEASKLQKQLNSINSAIGVLGGKNSVGLPRKQHICKRESQNSEGAKSAVGEGESREECLARVNARNAQ